jgi:molybdopterin-guanine dinucleotide biosynthesis protein A
MVFPSAPLLTAECEKLVRSGADVAVPVTTHGYEPFHAVYRRESCLPVIHECLEAGETRATMWYDRVKIVEFDHDMTLKADPRGGAFVNVNTPDELHDMEHRLLSGEITELQ